jgi:hypothetical protein
MVGCGGKPWRFIWEYPASGKIFHTHQSLCLSGLEQKPHLWTDTGKGLKNSKLVLKFGHQVLASGCRLLLLTILCKKKASNQLNITKVQKTILNVLFLLILKKFELTYR